MIIMMRLGPTMTLKIQNLVQGATTMKAFIFMLTFIVQLLHPVGCHTAAAPGGDSQKDHCQSCKGENSTCRGVSGIYSKPQLNVGYNFVAHIPKGVCNLTITEIRKSPNHLALQRKDGSYIFNGDWRLSPTGEYYDSGTAFHYKRQDLKILESVTSLGPIQNPLDLMVLYQQPNPIIKYEYMLPQHLDSPLLIQDSPALLVSSPNHLRQPEAATSRPTGHVSFPYNSGFPHHNQQRQQTLSILQQPQQHPSLPSSSYNSISSFPVKPHNSLGSYDDGPLTPTGNALYPGESNSPAVYNNPHYLNSVANQRRNQNSGKLHSVVNGDGSDKKFYWKITGYTNCSEPCGGGIQSPIFKCVRGSASAIVSDRRCTAEEKPTSQPSRCNVKPCPAEWVIGEWSSCSADCGKGHKTRSIRCQQRVSPTLKMVVAEGACLQQRPSSRLACELRPCNHWKTSNWNQCSAKCGAGYRKREVECVGSNGQLLGSQECDESEKPAELAVCNMGPCEGVDWFASEWSAECSQQCGSGIQTRHVVCSSLKPTQNQLNSYPTSYLDYAYSYPNGSRKSSSKEFETNFIDENGGRFPVEASSDTGPLQHHQCDESKKPASERECFSERNCGEAVWFTSDWSQCSETCGSGIRTRQVLCVIFTRGKFKVTSENVCSSPKKPAEKERCDSGIKCPQRWFTTEWTECSALCGGGLQKRSVSCRASNWTLPSSLCFDKDRPVERKSCNEQKCTLTPVTTIPTSSTRISNSGEMVRDKPVSFRPYSASVRSTTSPTSSPTSQSFSSRGSSSSYPTADTNDDTDDATSCTDQYRNCALVVQARLCRYKYYRSVCCNSCLDAVA